MIFTVEETALTGAFDHSSRMAAIADMATQLGFIQDEELKEQVYNLRKKLESMEDEEFLQMDFAVYEEDEHE